jgi:hypothetical protein
MDVPAEALDKDRRLGLHGEIEATHDPCRCEEVTEGCWLEPLMIKPFPHFAIVPANSFSQAILMSV